MANRTLRTAWWHCLQQHAQTWVRAGEFRKSRARGLLHSQTCHITCQFPRGSMKSTGSSYEPGTPAPAGGLFWRTELQGPASFSARCMSPPMQRSSHVPFLSNSGAGFVHGWVELASQPGTGVHGPSSVAAVCTVLPPLAPRTGECRSSPRLVFLQTAGGLTGSPNPT